MFVILALYACANDADVTLVDLYSCQLVIAIIKNLYLFKYCSLYGLEHHCGRLVLDLAMSICAAS